MAHPLFRKLEYVAVRVAVAFGCASIAACQSLSQEEYSHLPEISRQRVESVKGKPAFFDSELVTLKTRPMTLEKFLYMKPAKPSAALILFAGAGGTVALKETNRDVSLRDARFLIRNRNRFCERNLAVVIIDTDQSGGMTDGFRISDEAITDLEAVIRFLRADSRVPVWVVATSRGTISATALAIKTRQPIDGLVLTSSMDNVAGMDLDKIKVPVFLGSHRDDQCPSTPPSLERLKQLFRASPRVEAKMFTGNVPPISGKRNVCSGRSAHGFLGSEDEVIDAISAFIATLTAGEASKKVP